MNDNKYPSFSHLVDSANLPYIVGGMWKDWCPTVNSFFRGGSTITSLIRRIILKREKKLFERENQNQFFEARMGSCVINYEFMFFFLPSLSVAVDLTTAVSSCLVDFVQAPWGGCGDSHSWAYFP